MINAAVNQCFARTLLTSFTALISVFVLYIVGGEGIHAFAFALLVGFIAGVYSTIYIANPVLLWLSERAEAAAAQRAAARPPRRGRPSSRKLRGGRAGRIVAASTACADRRSADRAGSRRNGRRRIGSIRGRRRLRRLCRRRISRRRPWPLLREPIAVVSRKQKLVAAGARAGRWASGWRCRFAASEAPERRRDVGGPDRGRDGRPWTPPQTLAAPVVLDGQFSPQVRRVSGRRGVADSRRGRGGLRRRPSPPNPRIRRRSSRPPAGGRRHGRPVYAPVGDGARRGVDDGRRRTAIHVVHNGDTLERLAERYLGDGRRALELFDLNRDVLENPHLLPIGAELRIPGGFGGDVDGAGSRRADRGDQLRQSFV